MSPATAGRVADLTTTEVAALFRLVFRRPVPAEADDIPEGIAVAVLAAGLLKGYGFDQAVVFMVLARMWAWIEDDEDRHVMTLNVVDRRYIGWNWRGQSVLVDGETGREVSPRDALPTVLESVAYNLYELLRRHSALVRGERTSLWGGTDAATHTARGAAPEVGGGLGESPVLRDDPGDPADRRVRHGGPDLAPRDDPPGDPG